MSLRHGSAASCSQAPHATAAASLRRGQRSPSGGRDRAAGRRLSHWKPQHGRPGFRGSFPADPQACKSSLGKRVAERPCRGLHGMLQVFDRGAASLRGGGGSSGGSHRRGRWAVESRSPNALTRYHLKARAWGVGPARHPCNTRGSPGDAPSYSSARELLASARISSHATPRPGLLPAILGRACYGRCIATIASVLDEQRGISVAGSRTCSMRAGAAAALPHPSMEHAPALAHWPASL